MTFLHSICILCRTARHLDLSQGLDIFCHSYELAENIKVRGHPAPLGKGARPPGTGTLGGQRLGGARLGSGGTGCWQLPGPIPLVLCRCCWKRSPGTNCARRCASKPCLPSPN